MCQASERGVTKKFAEAEPKRMGRPPKISRDDILNAAARQDPAELQLTAIAQELAISVKTVYYYFPSRQSLIAALTDRAVSQMALPAIGEAADWRQALREDALWHYRLGISQPGWFKDAGPPSGVKRVGMELLRLIIEKLGEFGWSRHDAYRSHLVISNWAVSTGEAAHQSFIKGTWDVEEVRRTLEDYADPAIADGFTQLMKPFRSEDELFEDGLNIVLAGIEAAIATP